MFWVRAAAELFRLAFPAVVNAEFVKRLVGLDGLDKLDGLNGRLGKLELAAGITGAWFRYSLRDCGDSTNGVWVELRGGFEIELLYVDDSVEKLGLVGKPGDWLVGRDWRFSMGERWVFAVLPNEFCELVGRLEDDRMGVCGRSLELRSVEPANSDFGSSGLFAD